MNVPIAYAFSAIVASITGPGGSYNLGYGAGNAEDAIHVDMSADKTTTTTGADGSIMQSLHASNTGTITFRLLKTSPVNYSLSTLYNAQRGIASLWGQNVIRIQDINRGDVILGSQMAFVKAPSLVYATDGNVNEWAFRGKVIMELGAGVADVNV